MAVTPSQRELSYQVLLLDNTTQEPLSNKEVTITYKTTPEGILGAEPTATTATKTTDTNGIINATTTFEDSFDTDFGVEVYFAGDNTYEPKTVKLTRG